MVDQIATPGPQTRIDPGIESRLVTAGRFVRWVAVVYALLSLAGTASDQVRALLPSGPGFVRDLPVASALPLALLAIGALLAGHIHGSTRGVTWRRLGSGISSVILVFGLYVVVVYTFDFPSLWPWGTATLALPSLWVGLIVAVLATAVLVSTSRIDSRIIFGQVGSLLVFSVTAVIFLGYVYGDVTVGRLFRPPEITIQAALTSLLISVGVILMRPGSGILAAASSPGAGGRMLRRFGPVILLLPALLLLAVESVAPSDRINALVFVSVGLGLFLLALLAVVVRVIDETKIEALTSAAEAERARLGLEQEAPLVRSLSETLHIVDLDEAVLLDVATRFRPGQGSVAGDSSAVRSLPDGSVGVVLVDMTGHGADPAIRAIRVRDLLLHSIALGKTPAEALSLVGWTSPGDVLASAIAAKVDPEDGAVSMASAGHPPAIFIGPQEAELVESTGPLLYLHPDAEYAEVRFVLSPGDSLVLFSDGVADVQRIRDGRPEPRVLADLLLAEGGAATRTADLVIGFADPVPSDDQSALVIRREP